MEITIEQLVRLLRAHSSYLAQLAVAIEQGQDIKDVIDHYISENSRTTFAVMTFDHREFMAADPRLRKG